MDNDTMLDLAAGGRLRPNVYDVLTGPYLTTEFVLVNLDIQDMDDFNILVSVTLCATDVLVMEIKIVRIALLMPHVTLQAHVSATQIGREIRALSLSVHQISLVHMDVIPDVMAVKVMGLIDAYDVPKMHI